MNEKTKTELIELAQTLEATSTKLKQTIASLAPTSNTVSAVKELTFSTLKFEHTTS
jgi:ABC-type transporter Mla subunit MlaD